MFDLVAAITPWERAPGDIVDAWTYNGVVPAPSIHLEIGDRAEFRLRNELPIATDLHLHGLNVENAFDGVAPITQDLDRARARPSPTSTPPTRSSVAMYHPHFHSQIGLPNGMFGTIFVGQVPIPRGQTVGGEIIPADLVVTQEFPMVLNDSGVIGYSLNGKSFPATAPIVAGPDDWVLFHYFNEGTQIHPMHLHQFDQIVRRQGRLPARSALRRRHPQRRSRASATRCSSSSTSPERGCGTATSSPTSRARTACSAWSPPSSSSDRDQGHPPARRSALTAS